MLAEVIGKPAMFEQLGEELCELAQCCFKVNRERYGENLVHKAHEEIMDHFVEEVVDVTICMDELKEAGWINEISDDDDYVTLYPRLAEKMEPDDIVYMIITYSISAAGSCASFGKRLREKKMRNESIEYTQSLAISEYLGKICILLSEMQRRKAWTGEQFDSWMTAKKERMVKRLEENCE